MTRFLLLLATICTFQQLAYAQKGKFEGLPVPMAPSAELDAKFTAYRVFELDVAALNAHVKSGGQETGLILTLGPGESWRWSLKAHDMRAPNYRLRMGTPEGIIDLPRSENKTYRGQVTGGGRVRMTIDADFLLGLWEYGGETYNIEPLWRLLPGAPANQYVVYRDTDVIFPDAPICGWSEEWQHLMGHDMPVRQHSQVAQEKVGQCYKVEVALAADFSMFQFTGSVVNAENFMLGILNLVQTNYDNEFADEIDFDVVDYFVSTCSTCDPWTSSTNAGTLLNSFTNWGNGGGFGSNYDVASLWTNRDLAGTTIGVAWLGGLCTEDRYNVLQNFSATSSLLRVLQAHEIGHNFNAEHDAAGSNFIMAPSVNNTNQWSNFSITTMNSFISLLAGSGGCFSSCTVTAPPVAQIQAPATHICPGTTIPFIDNSTNNPTSWQWLFPGGIPSSSTEQHPTVRYDQPGTYTATLIVSNSAGTDATTLNTAITVNNQGTRYLMFETFENGPTFWDIGNSDGATTWSWKQVGGAQSGKRAMFMDNYTYTNLNQIDNLTSQPFDFSNQSGMQLRFDYAYKRYNAQRSDRFKVLLSINGGTTYPITLFDATENGTGNFATAPDSQNPFTPAVVNDWCYGTDFGADCIVIDLNDYIGQPNVRIRFQNINDNGNNLYIDNIRLTADCQTVTPPVAAMTATPTIGCAPLEVQYLDVSTGTVTSRQWNFPGGNPAVSTEINPVVTYSQPGVYSATLQVTNAAGTDLAVEADLITVLSQPTVNFTFSTQGFTVNFTNQTVNGNTYLWNFGDGATSTQFSPSHTYAAPGTYTVRLTATNQCGTRFLQKTVTIVNPLTAGFTANPESGCAPLTVTFNDTSTGGATSWSWTFAGGDPASATSQNPEVTFNTPGSYIVSLTVSNGSASSSFQDTIVVNGPPTAGFTANNPLGSASVSFNNTSVGADNYSWFFGDDSTSTEVSPTHVYAADGDYSVMLITENTCGSDTAEQIISILTPPDNASFTISTTSGCAPLEVSFSASPQAPGLSYAWIFEGGDPATSTDANPVVSYSAPGLYDVTLIVSNAAGSDTASVLDAITVNGSPAAGFTADNPLGVTAVAFSNTSVDADTYAWDFGDGEGSTEASPSHIYNADGVYMVTLIATNTCGSDTATQTITILTPPTAGWESDLSTGCAPLAVSFTASPQGPGLNYAWTFEGGDPAVSSEANPVVTYSTAGIYGVTLIVSNAAGADTITSLDTIMVNGGPTAGFSADNPLGVSNVAFNNTSTGADTYVWDFGDGTGSTEVSPVHNYSVDGAYAATLIATNACGSDTATQTINILLPPVASFESTPAAGCAPLTVNYFASPQGPGLTYAWTFEGGSPATSTEANPTVTYAEPGLYNATLILSNAAGSDTATTSGAVTVTGSPTADFNINTSLGITAVTFNNTSAGAETYSWDFGDGSGSAAGSPTHSYEADGEYTVTLIATNACGSDTAQQTVAILRPPVAGINNGPATGCAALEVIFSASPQGPGLSYQWIFEGGSPDSSADPNPVVSYSTPGVYDVTLIVSNAAGADTLTQNDYVTVTSIPTAGFSSTVNGFDVQFINTSINAASSNWNFGDGESSTELTPLHTYAESGTYIVTLTAENACGQSIAVDTVVIDESMPISNFDADQHEGCAPLTVQFNSLAINADSLWWQFPGGNPAGSSESNPIVVYDTPGAYNVTLIAFNSAGSASLTRTAWVVVSPAPEAGFEAILNQTTVQFTNNSTNADTYSWSFGDGSTSNEASPTHTYPGAGVYTVQLIATTACGADTSELTITIEGQAPMPDFSVDMDNGCAPLTVQFTDLSQGNPTSWAWSFPGGTPATSDEQNPVVTYNMPGSYDVALTVSNAFGSQNLEQSDLIFIDELPQAAFSYQISLLQVYFEVTNAQAGVTYEWDFGDGNSGEGLQVMHEYLEEGWYQIVLTATNDCGTNVAIQEIQIVVNSTGEEAKPANRLRLYPNPNKGQFTLEGELQGEEPALLTIYDAVGRKIDQRISVPVQHRIMERYEWVELPAGVYYLVIEVNSKTYYLDFIIQ